MNLKILISITKESGNIRTMLQNNLLIGLKDKTFKPDFINQNILDLTSKESKNRLKYKRAF